MPLRLLIPSIQRFERGWDGALLLTARQCSEKYHTTIPDLLLSQSQHSTEDEGIMWYAFRNDKPLEPSIEGDEEADDKWRKAWLERMERRE
jgi:hypothetical protein